MKKLGWIGSVALLLTACGIFTNVKNQVLNGVVLNSCGLLEFADSMAYLNAQALLELELDAYDPSPTQDEEQPLIDFENSKGFNSYRALVRQREDAIENRGDEIDDTNDPDTLLFDDVVTQSFLNQNRMMQIGNVIFYYASDCRLLKYQIYQDCATTLRMIDQHQKSGIRVGLAYDEIDICEAETDYGSVNRSACSYVRLEGHIPDWCQPNDAYFIIYYKNDGYAFDQGNLQFGDGNSFTLNGPQNLQSVPGLSCSNCEIINHVYPGATNAITTYTTTLNIRFKYIEEGQVLACDIDPINKIATIRPPCPIRINISYDLLRANFSVERCPGITYGTPLTYDWNFGDPQSNTDVATGQNTTYTYPCEREEGYPVSLQFSSGGCGYAERVNAFPRDNICCYRGTKAKCSPSNKSFCSQYIESSDGQHRVRVKLKERSKKITVVAIHKTKRNNGNYRRAKAKIKTEIEGPVYVQDQCKCDTRHNFVKLKGFKNRKRLRNVHKFFGSAAASVGMSQKTFREKWKRKHNDEWKVRVTIDGTDIQNGLAQIACD